MTRPPTLGDRLAALAESRPQLPAFHDRVAPGRWRTRTWSEVHAAAREVAGGLLALGLERGEPVALLGDNRSDWVVLQLGIQLAGGLPTPIYTTLTAEQAGFVLAHAGCRFAAADTPERLERLDRGAAAAGAEPPRRIGFHEAEAAVGAGDLGLDALRELGRSHLERVERRRAELDAEDAALLVYTSGTTGRPKGVELSHRALAATLEWTVSLAAPLLGEERYRVVSYLPLSHIAEQMMSGLAPIFLAGEVFFCPRVEDLREVLPEVRPTVFLAVPRVWEKLELALEARFAAAPALRRALLARARAVESAAFEAGVATGREPRSLARGLARRVVLERIHRALGLDRVRLSLSGAAPLPVSTLRFFASLALPIVEVYGMTETAALISATRPGRIRPGAVGPVLDIGELRLGGGGEILYRGSNLMSGYRADPAATAELIDAAGWLHTGDLGALDPDGSLRVTGRLKELLITAGGKNVAPAEVEPLLTEIRGVSQAVLVGDRRPYLCALLTLDPPAAQAVARELGIEAGSPAALARDRRFRAWLEREVEERVNARLARYQTVKRFEILDGELTIAGGELTPTLKLRRSEIAARYADRIAALYSEPGSPPSSSA
ncbi:MAG: Long-chain-fatty-acid--CoA ligase [Acidobacteria bacterium]|nr:Long-chain-fatty-acid--CoA ligase [Acidobacteriota bacterium]